MKPHLEDNHGIHLEAGRTRILEQHHHGLLKEIWHTDHREFRLALRGDEKMLESVVNRLREAGDQQPHR